MTTATDLLQSRSRFTVVLRDKVTDLRTTLMDLRGQREKLKSEIAATTKEFRDKLLGIDQQCEDLQREINDWEPILKLLEGRNTECCQ